MAIIGVSKVETKPFVSEKDPERGNPSGETVFEVGALDCDVQAKIGDNAMVMEQTEAGGTRFFMNGSTRNLHAVRFGLRGWKNFKDPEGNDIPFRTVIAIVNGKSYRVASDDSLNQIPQWLITEIGQEVLNANSLSAELEKNSGTP